MSAQMLPTSVAQRSILKFVTRGKIKSSGISARLRAQFGADSLSKIRLYD